MTEYKRLGTEFFSLRATEVAPKLLGKILCRRFNDGHTIRTRITETECYFGEEDTACHAHKGKTERTKNLYEKGGIAYVYLCYGLHSLLNVVTGDFGFPEAVLIRGTEDADGPGKLTKLLCIDRSFNGEDFISGSRLWIEDDGTSCEYISTTRIGIDYADEIYKNIKWRFVKL